MRFCGQQPFEGLKDSLRVIPTPLSAHESQAGAIGFDWAAHLVRTNLGAAIILFIYQLVIVAEREGFEPPIPLRVCRISSAVLSTTQPPLRGGRTGRIAHSGAVT
jgi:hypothetical protein